jgi:CheY-specific phosphatase CheX
MKKILMTAMMTSISEVMETMFFLPVEPGPESTLAQKGMDTDTLAGCINFSGDASGSLVIVAPRTLVGEMAENFMGESIDALTEEHFSGTMTEMLNMVCGNALSKIESGRPFELGIPEIVAPLEKFETEVFTFVATTQSNMAVLLQIDRYIDSQIGQ